MLNSTCKLAFLANFGRRPPERQNFGRRYIRKYGSNRKSKREFPRAKIGQRTDFWGLEDPKTGLDSISGHFEPKFQKSVFGEFLYFPQLKILEGR